MENEKETGRAERVRPWDGLISPAEIELYERAGFFKDVELGERPAVLVIDAQYNFCGDADEPVPAAAERYRFSCGAYAYESLPHIQSLLELARGKGMPIVYTKDMETFPDPTPDEAARGNEIIDELAPAPGDAVIEKQGYSGFFSTRMLSYLVSLNVDTVIICGGTTSGCVRATAIDAYDYRFKVFVVEECVFDRIPTPHKTNLFDIAAKAAKVITVDELNEMLGDRDFHGAFSDVPDSPVWRHVSD